MTVPTEPPSSSEPIAVAVPVWRRWLFPGLALVASIAALLAFWAMRQATTTRAPQSPALAPTEMAAGTFRGAVIQPAVPAPEIDLPTSDGARFRLADERGKVVVLFFGFTSCPDVCPTTLTQLAEAMGSLGPEADSVVPVFVSVDPDRDRPEFVESFLAGYDPRVVGLVPDSEALAEVAGRYGVYYGKEFPEGLPEDSLQYTMTHTASLFLIDPEGRLRVALVPPYTPDDVVHDIRALAEGPG